MTHHEPTIDGLRTVALLAVLFIHVGFGWAPGGFVGVDIFFVISGYLITGKIRRDLERSGGRFDWLGFYAGRLRRLYPAMLVTVAASFVAAYLLMSPAELKAFAWSVFATLTWWSNVNFWEAGGYFDSLSTTKPLLHTWSLAVEEQFYLLWPVALAVGFAANRRWGLPVAIAILGVLSFYLNYRFSDGSQYLANRFGQWESQLLDGETTLFFWAPFRAFEFAIGGLIVWADKVRRPSALDTFAGIAGAGFIVWGILLFNEDMQFPMHYALVPCIGASLVIWGRSSAIALATLGNSLVSGFGRRTYSIYLAHWPLVVFYGYVHVGAITLADQLLLCLGSVVLGYLLNAMVEEPFYRGRMFIKSPWRVIAAAAVAALVLVAPAYSAWQEGWIWRVNPHMRALMANWEEEIDTRSEGMIGGGDTCFPSGAEGDYPNDFPFQTCMGYQPGKRNVLVLGDSIGAYSIPGLVADADPSRINIMQNTLSGCRPLVGEGTKNCKARNDHFFAHLEQYRFDTLVLSAYWRTDDLPRLADTVAYLADRDIKVIVVGPAVRFSRDLPDIFASEQSEAMAVNRATQALVPGLFDLDAQMRATVTDAGLNYFSPLSVLCPKREATSCQIVIEGNHLVSFDTHHFMRSAAAYVLRDLLS